MSAAEPLVRTHDLTKKFGPRTAVNAVGLEVPRGTCFGFLGPNGAGKTTMIRLLLGLARPTSGQVWVDGVDVTKDPRKALSGVGAIVEEPRFFAQLTGIENLKVHVPLVGGDAAARIPTVLKTVGLDGRGDDKVKGYSMGMRQRLGVARALLGDPKLLILDEPTNGLDASGMHDFRGLIRRMVETEGRTVFLSSHLLDEMEKLCDTVAIVEQGQVRHQSSVSQLIDEGGRALLIAVNDPQRAYQVLMEAPEFAGQVTQDPDGLLRVPQVAGPEVAMALNHRLVSAGIGVSELRLERQTLERRFLDMTIGGTT